MTHIRVFAGLVATVAFLVSYIINLDKIDLVLSLVFLILTEQSFARRER